MNISQAIQLPGLSVNFFLPVATKNFLLVGGGREPAPAWLQSVAAGREVQAIDHGLDACFAAGLRPDFLLGDGDSATATNWAKAQQLAIPTERHPVAKDLTDTQLCLEKIKAVEPDAFVLLTGCFGGRLDHLFSTVYSFLHSGLAGCMADEQEALFFLRSGQKLSVRFELQPKALSLLPLSPVCTGVNSQGVRWPLTDATLTQQLPSAISNELSGRSWEIALQSGILGVYICWAEQERNL